MLEYIYTPSCERRSRIRNQSNLNCVSTNVESEGPVNKGKSGAILESAVRAVMKGEMGYLKSAQVHGVPKSTLLDFVKKIRNEVCRAFGFFITLYL